MSVLSLPLPALGYSRATFAVAATFPSDALSERRLRSHIERHFDFLWRSARRLGLSKADADDTTQEVCVVFARKLSQIEEGRERAFLFGTLLRTVATWKRAARRHAETPLETLDSPASLALSPEELHELNSARPLLQQILDAMPLEQRAVFVLFELEELTMAEIAMLVGAPLGTVATRLRSAREEFARGSARFAARRAFDESAAPAREIDPAGRPR